MEKSNFCTDKGICTASAEKLGSDCTYYNPDNHAACYHASWSTPMVCGCKEACLDAGVIREVVEGLG